MKKLNRNKSTWILMSEDRKIALFIDIFQHHYFASVSEIFEWRRLLTYKTKELAEEAFMRLYYYSIKLDCGDYKYDWRKIKAVNVSMIITEDV